MSYQLERWCTKRHSHSGPLLYSETRKFHDVVDRRRRRANNERQLQPNDHQRGCPRRDVSRLLDI
eukprot:9019822-Pyramimonas_sp.AAC.1